MITNTTDAARSFSVTRLGFADLAELGSLAHISEPNREHWTNKISDARMTDNGASWYGGIAKLADARSLLLDGWQDGAAKAQNVAPTLSNLVPPVHNVRRRLKWADNGAELSVDRALAGQWDVAFRTSSHQATNTPRVLTVACAFGAMASVNQDSMFWNAAQMIVVADLLEQAGYTVELRAIENTEILSDSLDCGKHVLVDVLVKSADQPLRADAIAAVFGHAGVYRTFGFASSMLGPFDVGGCLGRVADIRKHLELAVATGQTDSFDYILPHGFTKDAAVKNVVNALKTLTGSNANG